MKLILVLILIFQSAISKAEVIVRHPDTSPLEYEKAIGEGDQNVISHLNAQLPSATDENRLLQKFEKAQNLFLSSDLTSAKVAFIEVSEEVSRADWNETQRKAIFISFLRIAQLSSDPQMIQKYLTEASQFGPDIEADFSLFPPPLVSQYKNILEREKSKALQIDLTEKFPQHELVIIDGVRVPHEKMKAFLVMGGRHRVTALSNSHQALTQDLTATQLNLIRADVPAYAIGDCKNPALSGYRSIGAEQVKVIYPQGCTRTYTGTSWLDSSEEKTKIPNEFTSLAPKSFALKDTVPRPVSSKKLLLIGLGVGVIAASVILIAKSHHHDVEPVSHEGF